MDIDEKEQTPSGVSGGDTPQTTSGSGATPGTQGAAQPTTSATAGPSTRSSTLGPSSTSNSKRRRGLGVVTPNACTECRKKRAKCDGNKPCGRCKTQKGVECVYEVPVRQSKENLRTEIEYLRYRQRSSDQVFAALSRPKLWEEVITRLRNGQSVETISEWLGAGAGAGGTTLPPAGGAAEMQLGDAPGSIADYGPDGAPSGLANLGSHGAGGSQASPWHFSTQSHAPSTRSNSVAEAMSWTADAATTTSSQKPFGGDYWNDSMRPDHMSETMPRYRGVEHLLSPLSEADMQNPSGTWTNMTTDINLVHHLLALYFCWEYPTFASLSKEHFLRDFQNGRQRFCSPILINALLALGCRFSTQPMTREVPNDPYSSGDHFFKEALRLFHNETDHRSLTTIQALGIMAIREASSGRDSESWYYAGQSQKLAIEMGLHQTGSSEEDDDDDLAVKAATFWGAFALDHAWSLATGSLPQASFIPILPMKPGIIADIEASLWVPYTDDGAPLQRSCEQPSNVRSVYKCFCELSELVHKSLYVLHSPGQPLTARVMLNIYTQYLNWYDRIPEVLRLGHNFTPAVLFAHMYYHFAILLLFRPLIKLRIVGSKVSPRDVCLQAADAIQRLLTSYSQLYTLRLTPTFVPYFVLTATILRLAIGATRLQGDSSALGEQELKDAARMDPQSTKALQQGIADLTEMVPCHHFAEQALNILQYLAKKWDIEVDMGPRGFDTEKLSNLKTPYSSSLNFFAPNIVTEDFIGRWGAGNVLSDTGSVSALQRIQRAAESISRESMWPFPIQGRSRMPVGQALEDAGFALL